MRHKNNFLIVVRNLLVSGFFGVALLFFFLPYMVGASNPPAPFDPSMDILDPGASSVPGGGCGPTDTNCYVAPSEKTVTQEELTAAFRKYVTKSTSPLPSPKEREPNPPPPTP